MASLRSEMLDHLLDKFEDKDKIILRKMIKASLDNDDNEAVLAHRVFTSVVAYIGAHSTLSCFETTALESIQETLASLATDAQKSPESTQATPATSSPAQGSYFAKKPQQTYTHDGGKENSHGHGQAPGSTAQTPTNDLAKLQLDDHNVPKSSSGNFAMKVMTKNGWKPGQGLGMSGDGITEPILPSGQLVPDRKDFNPGVGSQKRMEHQSSGRVVSSASQKQDAGPHPQDTSGQSFNDGPNGDTWESSFDKDPLLFQNRPRHLNSYFNGW
ncbi:hypothetical protein PG990_006010 [Apiospora arundinis]